MNAVMPKTITKIEANPILSRKNSELEMLDVAAYCRVSTDSDEQLDSYDAQVAYYVRALLDCIRVNTDVTLTIVIKGGLSFTVEIPT